jgi:ribosomal protein L40E
MSGLTRKQVYVDRNLSAVLGMSEGELVSYADIQKRLHKYIKDNDLKNLNRPRPQPSTAPSAPAQISGSAQMKRCKDCGAEIPPEAVFCDLCGVNQ